MINKNQLDPIDFNPFAGGEIDIVAPTTEPQKEIWISCVLGGDKANLAYNESLSLVLRGNLNTVALTKAVRYILERHEALRASFSADGESIVISSESSCILREEDISAFSASDQREHIRRFLDQEMNTPFVLSEGNLIRFTLHKLKNDEHLLTLVAHHIISDGWSFGVILEDIGRAYSAINNHGQYTEPPPPQISQYNLDELLYRQSEAYTEALSYWLDQYKGDVPELDFPTDYPRTPSRSYEGHRYDTMISREQTAFLKKKAAEYGCSAVNLLLSVFELFIFSKTKHTDVTVGLPTAGQICTENFGLVGHCVNLLPIRAKINPKLTVSEYLKSRRSAFFDAIDHQRITFGEIVKKLKIKRDASRIPLVPIMFNVDIGMDNEIAFDGLTHALISNPREHEAFELFLNINEHQGELVFEWSYNTSLFRQETITALAEEYHAMISTILSHPEKTILEITGDQHEKKHILQLFSRLNATKTAYLDHETLIDLFRASVNKYGEKAAIRFNDRQMTYLETDHRSDQIAAYLGRNGIGQGACVALLLDRSPDLVTSLLGVMKAGACYIPIDPQYPAERIAYMLNDAGAAAVITSESHTDKAPAGTPVHLMKDIEDVPDLQRFPLPQIHATDLAYILYTSGSTGNPKGVQITHRNLVNFLLSMQKEPGMSASDRLLAITTISFDIAGLELYLPLICGAEIVLADTETARDGRLIPDKIVQHDITVMQATPATWRMLLDAGWEGKADLKILCGGEALPKELAQKLIPKCRELWNMYGPTETTIWSTIKRIDTEDGITIGKPIDNTYVYILNEQGELAAPMKEGEIYIAGDGVSPGYLNRPELTSERFIPDPFATDPAAVMYRTGDMGMYNNDLQLLCLGRADHQVKIRGFRIELEEIEGALMRLGDIQQAVVVAQTDQSGNNFLVAYVKPERNGHIVPNVQSAIPLDKTAIDSWKAGISLSLPDYMIPHVFVGVTEFPLTPNNKIDRKKLPKPQAASPERKAKKGFSTNEKVIASIWRDILGLREIDRNDDFFELGGHSLSAVQVMIRVEKETGKKLPLTTLFDHSVLHRFAQLIDNNNEAQVSWDSLVPIKPEGSKLPIYIVHGFGLNVLVFKGLAEHVDPEQPLYGLQAKGLDGSEVDENMSFEDIAAGYIEEIIKHNPSGPYLLGGYSLGGIIAFEMARQLKNRNKEVAFIGLIDTFVTMNDFHRKLMKSKNPVKIVNYLLKVAVHSVTLILQYPVAYFIHKFRFVFGSLYNIYASFKFRRLIKKDPKNHEYILQRLQYIYDNAYCRYRFEPLDNDACLFKSDDLLLRYFPRYNSNGWQPYFIRGLKIKNVPTGHLDFFTPENAHLLASSLQTELDKVNKLYE